MVLWKQLLPKQTETNHTGFIILTWWAQCIFKDNTFIQYPDSRLAFSPPRKRARAASGNDHLAWFYELLHPEDWDEQATATSVIFFSFWKEASASDGGCPSTKFQYSSTSSKLKSKFFVNYFQNHFPLSSLCPSFSVAQHILLLPTIFSLLLKPFSQ